MKLHSLNLFEEHHMLAILMYVDSNPYCMKTNIYEGVSRNPRMPDKIHKLREAGLIEGVRTGNQTYYILTERGSSVAELFVQVAHRISEDPALENTL